MALDGEDHRRRAARQTQASFRDERQGTLRRRVIDLSNATSPPGRRLVDMKVHLQVERLAQLFERVGID